MGMAMINHVSPKGIPALLNSDNHGGELDQWRNQNLNSIAIVNFKDDESLRLRHPAFDSSSSSSSGGEEEEEEFQKSPVRKDVWMSIQNEMQKPEDDGGWDSILQGGKSDGYSGDLPPPPVYVHPLVKRSANCLSEKSLELCTESLGSETGSELGHKIGEDDGDWALKETTGLIELNVSKYTKSSATAVRPLPPPIPSIAGGSFLITSRRRNGRLVIEAVSVPPKSCFRAKRGGGRLILSLIGAQSEETGVCAVEEQLPMTTVRKTGVPPLPPPAKKLTKQNRQFSNEISKERKELELSVVRSLPVPHLRRRMIPTNEYEYFWRKKTTVSAAGGGGFEPYCIATS